MFDAAKEKMKTTAIEQANKAKDAAISHAQGELGKLSSTPTPTTGGAKDVLQHTISALKKATAVASSTLKKVKRITAKKLGRTKKSRTPKGL